MSSQTVYWRVRLWDVQAQCSAWSAPASWTMGLLVPATTSDRDGPSPVAAESEGVTFLRQDQDRVVYSIGSGDYEFEIAK